MLCGGLSGSSRLAASMRAGDGPRPATRPRVTLKGDDPAVEALLASLAAG